MILRQCFKNAFKFRECKHTSPFAIRTLKREGFKASTSNDKTVGAINRFDVASLGFFKRRTVFKDKLFRCAITRYFLLKFGALCFAFGQFFLGRFVAISEYFELILQESNPLSQNAVSFHTRENIQCGFNRSVDNRDIHNNELDFENRTVRNSNQNGNKEQ